MLDWIVDSLKHPPREVDGLPRSHASIHGNALGACTRLGLASDHRTERLAEAIISWQWPDGGWNCDHRADGHRSSFHESLRTAWGLQEYAAATGHAGAREAAARAVELFLQHRVFRRGGTGEPINARWLSTPYPSYWHYDLLTALLVISRGDRCTDPRAADALDVLERKRRPDGRWNAQAQWWRAADSRTTPEVVDWGGAGQPNLMVTLNALRVLTAAGRLTVGRSVTVAEFARGRIAAGAGPGHPYAVTVGTAGAPRAPWRCRRSPRTPPRRVRKIAVAAVAHGPRPRAPRVDDVITGAPAVNTG